MRRSRVIAAVAVIAIVIVSVFYIDIGLSNFHTNPKKILESDGHTTYLWNGNFSGDNNYSRLGILKSEATINDSGYPISYLNTSMYGFGAFVSGGNYTLFQIYDFMNGTLAPNLPVKSVVMEQNGTVPTKYYGNQIEATMGTVHGWGFNFSTGSGNPGYSSAASPPSPEPNISNLKMSYSWPLINASASNNYPYRFSVVVELVILVYGVGPNDPFYMNFNSSLEGLGQPVYAQTLITVNDLSGA